MDVSKDKMIPLIRDFFKQIQDSGITTLPRSRRISVLVDNTYSVLKKEEVMSMIESNPLLIGSAKTSTNSELFDCDDYALQLKASLTALFRNKRLLIRTIAPPAIGIVITQNHALNIALCESSDGSMEILLVDPSTESPKLVSNPSESTKLLKTLPVTMIYI